MIQAYPTSGEINFKLQDTKEAIQRVVDFYASQASRIDETDGVGMEFEDKGQVWRFNLRSSNTEPLVRLNIEAQSSKSAGLKRR